MFSGVLRRDASLRPGRWPSRISFPACCILLGLLLLIPFGRGSALQNKACRELYDPESLSRLRTVCVDTSYLGATAASGVKEFVARGSQPGQLLTRVSWRFADRCEGADAILRVYFTPGARHVSTPKPKTNPNVNVPSLDYYEPISQVVLLIYGRASVRLLYRTDAQGGGRNWEAALKPLFSKLVKDINQLGH